ncbi:tryptophan 2,3-dioxygenase [Bradyrhizobium diazoefficiens]|jgi:tryptophan 2,3-dioxygenase|uniref:Tryptophan 2,3-dioxygenase n=2 Tax=Bradyrhizobium diazoefficiens TaxID=1355477 RepID=T23O_BRADU|nr:MULTISPECIES: tryptophan 2,3-dioxygenase [Bradyrhizobium]Q89MN4.1 RecName: Full=Tryptophan 2,3-dioxygenase; Short=TDO; AltName: Full=Tryptamin 2,3-dioxygenase; AltName: Full=Tryptophan oxygenase; Short=TO; Short=TRPO; AltName: Full=Tryptophan pyrrolase; AltName: Full=Tryptophanase [Bradyrhizobium diazoefficiens USDA 110]MBP1065850.1 tryptophan 2,3-dioxygenase [Bradyrhizobium japonicum]AND89453.1 tryptophan 2,3-dioxygenase [Bradyrhizobium diazoefficiens USDA 110]APO53782.1 tryptophan 2,3-diox
MTSSDYDPASEGAETDFSRRMSYGDYLALDAILGAQHPLSEAHDEMLFIIQHQTTELWMRLAIHELSAARRAIARDEVQPAMKMLARMSRIFEQLNNAWDVLRTMTPSEYTRFRSQLGQSSGFQSRQYRLIEYLLGNRNHAMLKPHAHDAEVTKLLEAELATPSLYDEVLRLADRNGLTMPAAVLSRDVRETHSFNEGVLQAWRVVYEAPETHWMLYELAEKLVDFEDYFRRWRFNHVTTVERVIGFKRGTGGTGGVSYLKRMLEVELFPELWRVRTIL